MLNKLKSKLIIEKTIILSIFVVFSLLILWKCKYGWVSNDENLYITTPYRLIQGDALFFDEQHRTQLYSFLVYPIMKLYLVIFKTTDGIYLNFRYIYCIFQILVAIFIYHRFKQINRLGAIVAAIIYMIYTPYNLMGLSYNTICIDCLTVSLTLLATYKNNIEIFLTGLLFAASVLCCPLLSVLYFVYAIICIVNKEKDNFIFNKEILLYLTLGITTLALVFIIFVLSRTSLTNVINSLDSILIDPEYKDTNYLKHFVGYFGKILFTISNYSIYLISSILLLIGIFCVSKNKIKIQNICIYLIVIITTLLIIDCFLTRSSNYAYIIFPTNILGLFLVSIDKRLNRKILIYILPAIYYTFAAYMTSDVGTTIITSSSIVLLVLNIVVIIDYCYNKNNKILNILVTLLLIILISLQVYQKFNYTHRKNHISINTYIIDSGPAKGLIYDENSFYEYEENEKIVNYINNNYNVNNVLFLTPQSNIYMIGSNYRNAGPSTWKTCFDYCIDMLNTYYYVNPKKMPDLIYVDESLIKGISNLNIIDNYDKEIVLNNKTIFIKKSK